MFLNWISSAWLKPIDLFSRFEPTGRLGRFFNFPLMRVLVVVVFLAPVVLVNSIVVMQVIENLGEPGATIIDMVRMILTFFLLIVSYRFYCSVFERRSALEVGFTGSGREIGFGALAGVGIVSFVVMVLWLAGSYSIEAFGSGWIIPKTLIQFGVGAFLQELVLVCVVYRLIEEFTGSWIAIVISLLIFSVAHGANPNASAISVAALFFSSIILLAPFILTRRIWLSWGFHAGWNFMQAGFFGMPNSGIQFPGWIESVIEGPSWLTGGAIGIEGSIVAIGSDIVLGLGLLMLAIRRDQLVAPSWKRQSGGRATGGDQP